MVPTEMPNGAHPQKKLMNGLFLVYYIFFEFIIVGEGFLKPFRIKINGRIRRFAHVFDHY